MANLTKAQKAVIDAMRQGSTLDYEPRSAFSSGGYGLTSPDGAFVASVNARVVTALEDATLIERTTPNSYGRTVFRLTAPKPRATVTLGKTEGPDGERSASILLDGVEIGSLETWKQINRPSTFRLDFSHVYVMLWEPYDYEGTFDADTYGDANTARRAALVAVRRYLATRDAAPLSAEERRKGGV